MVVVALRAQAARPEGVVSEFDADGAEGAGVDVRYDVSEEATELRLVKCLTIAVGDGRFSG